MQNNHTLITNPTRTSYLHTISNTQKFIKPPNPLKIKEKQTRSLSIYGTPDYQRSLNRAFSRAKLLSFFNPDLQYFITFTYKQNILDENQTLYDIKQFLKKEKRNYSQKKSLSPTQRKNSQKTTQAELSTFPQPPNRNKITDVAQRKKEQETRRRKGCGNVENSDTLSITHAELSSIFEAEHKNEANPFKYIYVFERQKRGAIHVHMISNTPFTYFINKNGYKQLQNWPHGFSSILTIEDLDDNFKPYLYLFKYMQKAQRIGKSFIHTSRKSFDKLTHVDYDLYIEELQRGNLLHQEDYDFILQEKRTLITKEYIRKTY